MQRSERERDGEGGGGRPVYCVSFVIHFFIASDFMSSSVEIYFTAKSRILEHYRRRLTAVVFLHSTVQHFAAQSRKLEHFVEW